MLTCEAGFPDFNGRRPSQSEGDPWKYKRAQLYVVSLYVLHIAGQSNYYMARRESRYVLLAGEMKNNALLAWRRPSYGRGRRTRAMHAAGMTREKFLTRTEGPSEAGAATHPKVKAEAVAVASDARFFLRSGLAHS